MDPAEAALPALAAMEAALDPVGEAHHTGFERAAGERLRLQWPWSLLERWCLAHEPSHSYSLFARPRSLELPRGAPEASMFFLNRGVRNRTHGGELGRAIAPGYLM
jgi:hypothetical protein